MTARAPIPAVVRFEFRAPEGATVYCEECDDAHYLQVVDVEAVWEPVVEAGSLAGFRYSLRLTGEDPSCEVTLGSATDPWMRDILNSSYCVVRSLDQVRVPPSRPLWEDMI